MLNRRSFLTAGPLALAGSSLPAVAGIPPALTPPLLPVVLRSPDLLRVQLGDDKALLRAQRGEGGWTVPGVEIRTTLHGGVLDVAVHAPGVPLQRIHLRWHGTVSADTLVLGDAWERSYGDLGWLSLQPERVLPWYAVASRGLGHNNGGVGIKTGAAAFAFWQIDAEGVSLWLDVRNGGNGVLLGDRLLHLASVVQLATSPSPWRATQTLCRMMAAGTDVRRVRGAHSLDVIYGSNDWYYAYGKNTADGILRDADLMRELAPPGAAKPFCIIDDGYQDTARFPSLPRLAADIRSRGCVPGIWIRPLQAAKGKPENWMLPAQHWRDRSAEAVYDPTIPEAREAALDVVRQARDWGYDFLKHDFTTYELLGGWGKDFGASPTRDGWRFHDRSKTNAEIIRELYRDIRKAAGDDRIILGCNTIGHLSAGIFDASRTGDDTSGREWERTRRMGVNTLAFRLPQDRIFFRTDADCVAFTPDVPWPQTEAWLKAVAASGSMLLVSADPRSTDVRAKEAIKAAFSVIARTTQSEPLDWMESRTPSHWKSGGKTESYDWLEEAGASPFSA